MVLRNPISYQQRACKATTDRLNAFTSLIRTWRQDWRNNHVVSLLQEINRSKAKQNSSINNDTRTCVKVSYVHIYLCPCHTTKEAHSHVPAPNDHIGTQSCIVLQYVGENIRMLCTITVTLSHCCATRHKYPPIHHIQYGETAIRLDPTYYFSSLYHHAYPTSSIARTPKNVDFGAMGWTHPTNPIATLLQTPTRVRGWPWVGPLTRVSPGKPG